MFPWNLAGIAINEGIKYVGNKIIEGISIFVGFLKNAWNKFDNFLGNLITKVFDFVSNWLSSVVQQIVSIFNKLGNLINSLKEKIYVATNGVYTAIFTGSALNKSQQKVSKVLEDNNLKIEDAKPDIAKAVLDELLHNRESEIEAQIHVSQEEQERILRSLGLDPQLYEITRDN